MTARRCCQRLVLLLAAIGTIARPVPAVAHDIGLTHVDMVVRADGTFRADIDVDPEALARRLQLAAGQLPDDDRSNQTDPGRLIAMQEAFVDAVEVRVEGQPVPLTFAYASRASQAERDAAATGTVSLTGTLPPGSVGFTWRYTLPLGSYALRVSQPGVAAEQVVWLVGSRPSEQIRLAPAASSLWRVARQYARLGVLHIVPRGLDHILFVLSLFLLSPSWRPLLAQVSAFTLAHTLTLGASVVGLISVSPRLVEPLIAASIAWVALENLWREELSRTRVAVVFLFGLLHGLGFAGVLAELGLPAGARIAALLAFNVGVELGQVFVLAVALGATAALVRYPRQYRRWLVVPGSLAIACVGVYWTVTRVVGE